MAMRKNLPSSPSADSRQSPPALDLALQGGGSHGAFTWGVLDRVLEDDSLPIDGVSGTSAGAMNAAVMAVGMAEGGRRHGRERARTALREFWLDLADTSAVFGGGFGAAEPATPAATAGASGVGSMDGMGGMGGTGGAFSPWADPSANPWAAWQGPWLQANPFWVAWQNLLQTSLKSGLQQLSPYQFNPLDLNPLRDVLRRHVREAPLRRTPLHLFITATAVRTGQPRVFQRDDLSLDALLASACLPQLFKAVHIDGEPYWDGGYSGNPALWPLIYNTAALDVLLVRINPLQRLDLPDTALEISDRVNEITFNAALVSELRAIRFVQKLVTTGSVDADQYKALRLHMVGDDEHLAALSAASKLNTSREFLLKLFGYGREAAQRWLTRHRADIGQRSSLDLEAEFLAPRARQSGLTPATWAP